MDNPLDYRITGQQQITLSLGAFDGEIFTITVDSQPKNTVAVVAAQTKVSSYVLPAGTTDIPAGTYTVNKHPGEDVGEFMVVVDRQVQYRNTTNGTSGGDYQEIAGIIRMNEADLINDRKVTLIWVGAVVDNPQDSQLALMQVLAGQIDAMVPTLAALAGVPENTFQAAPNDPDLVAFGATVINHESRIVTNENKLATIDSGTYTPVLSNSANIDAIAPDGVWQWMKVGNIVTVSGFLIIDPTTASTLTAADITLPIASAVQNVAGAVAGSGNFQITAPVRIGVSSTGHRARFELSAPGTTLGSCSLHFTYRII
jgi:hypothetical protein